MKITKYKKNGKNYYKFQIRLGNKVTRRSGFKTQNEAIYAYNKLLEDYQNKIDGNISYYEVYYRWRKIYQTKVKETTLNQTTSIYKLHILPIFGSMKIKDITPNLCQQFALDLLDYVKGKEYYGYARRIMDYAVKTQLIITNPFDKVILPTYKKPTKQINYLTVEEVTKLLNYFKNDQYWYTLFRTLIYTGLRRGEILALEWRDVDIKNKTITINKTLSIGKDSKVVLSTPKTQTSQRTIDVDQETLEELEKLKRQTTSTIVFPSNKGGYRRLSDISDKLTKTLKALNIKQIRVHDLRHTHASLLFASGCDMKYVQERLGHSDIKTTMNIYTHVTKDRKEVNLINFTTYMKTKRA